MKPGSATITNVANTSQGVVGWAQQSRDPDSAHIIAHTEDKEPSRKPTLLWSIFGQGIGLELLHCLEDGSHAVRLEAAYVALIELLTLSPSSMLIFCRSGTHLQLWLHFFTRIFPESCPSSDLILLLQAK